jgi:hypothetical protein
MMSASPPAGSSAHERDMVNESDVWFVRTRKPAATPCSIATMGIRIEPYTTEEQAAGGRNVCWSKVRFRQGCEGLIVGSSSASIGVPDRGDSDGAASTELLNRPLNVRRFDNPCTVRIWVVLFQGLPVWVELKVDLDLGHHPNRYVTQ